MKTSSLLLLFLSFVLLSGCKKDLDNDDDPVPGTGYEHHFLNQPLQGKINGKAWLFAAGNVEPNSWDSAYSYEIVDTLSGTDTCWIIAGGSTYEKVIFNLANAAGTLDTGLYKLKLDWNGDATENRTATLVYVVNNGTPQNMIASSGAIHITEVDVASKMQVKGEADIWFDASNYVNGSFVLKYCP